MPSFPIFHTRRLVLRAPTLADVPSYHRHFVNYEIIRHLSARVPWPYPTDGVANFLANFIIPTLGKERWAWGLFFHNEPETIIGMIELWRKGNPENRGFWLGQEFWGQGLMTEAVSVINTYAFEKLGFEELIFSNAVGNTASRRIKEKTGAQYLGSKPAGFVDPNFTEQELWRLTKEQWQELHDQK